MSQTKKAAPRVATTDLQTLAARAVERATAARQSFVELNAAELQAVSGGALPVVKVDPLDLDINKLIIRGGTAGIIYYPPVKNVLF